MITLSNTLADKAERVKVEWAGHRQAEDASITHALAVGALLCEARAETAYGQWLPFLDRAGIGDRQARRLMQLARSGLKSDTVSALGGVKAAIAWLAGRKLPTGDDCLIVSLAEGDSFYPFVLVRPSQQGFWLTLFCEDGFVEEMRRPIIGGDDGVWLFADRMLEGRLHLAEFRTEVGATAHWASILEHAA